MGELLSRGEETSKLDSSSCMMVYEFGLPENMSPGFNWMFKLWVLCSSGGNATTDIGVRFFKLNERFCENLNLSAVPVNWSMSLTSDDSEFDSLGTRENDVKICLQTRERCKSWLTVGFVGFNFCCRRRMSRR